MFKRFNPPKRNLNRYWRGSKVETRFCFNPPKRNLNHKPKSHLKHQTRFQSTKEEFKPVAPLHLQLRQGGFNPPKRNLNPTSSQLSVSIVDVSIHQRGI